MKEGTFSIAHFSIMHKIDNVKYFFLWPHYHSGGSGQVIHFIVTLSKSNPGVLPVIHVHFTSLGCLQS